MLSPDQHTLVRAVEDARRILEEYIAAGPRDATQALERLLVVLDKGELVHALARISSRKVMRLEGRHIHSRRPGTARPLKDAS
jgi:IS5 family transposase